jgi:phytoene/squalene synthetase
MEDQQRWRPDDYVFAVAGVVGLILAEIWE